MIRDALGGKIDLIVTKSVSRFARNTVDSLTTVRKLKEKGVEVFFEKEGIYTLDSKGELLITIMSSLAQEESRSISENITWGQRKRFSDGKVNMPYKRFLGYEKGEDGQPRVVEKEAEVVRLIYRLYLEGRTPAGICRYLDDSDIPTPGGKPNWSQSTVNSILRNEKYKGDALLQKTFTVDFLTKKKKENEGEVPQYYVEGSHPPIIDPLEFDLAQAEITRRKALGSYYSGNSIFSSKLFCGGCGGLYGQKVWHSTDAYRRVVWQCNKKFQGKKKCATPHLDAETIQRMCLKAYNQMMGDRENVIADCETMRMTLCDCSKLDADIDALREKIQVVAEMVKNCVKENACVPQSQKEFARQYDSLVKRYEKAVARHEALTAERTQRAERGKQLRLFIESLREQPMVLKEWDERLWIMLIGKGTVRRDGGIAFTFKNGAVVEVGSEK